MVCTPLGGGGCEGGTGVTGAVARATTVANVVTPRDTAGLDGYGHAAAAIAVIWGERVAVGRENLV